MGKLQAKWISVPLREVLDYEQPNPYIIKTRIKEEQGLFPVLTANKSFIKGYTDETEGVYKNVPVIIFDDFTADYKFVDFPFKVKSSAMKFLKSKNKDVSLKYIYYQMSLVKVNTTTHKRYYISAYQNISFLFAANTDGTLNLQKQEDIVQEIETQFTRLDAAIKSLKTIKAKLELYRKSVLKAAFNAKKGWAEKRMEDIAEVTSSKRIFKNEYVDSGIPFYRTKEIVELSQDRSIGTELFISNEKYNEIKEKFDVPRKNEILLSAVGTIGISWVIKDERKFYFKDGNLLWIKRVSSVDPYFLKYYLDFLFLKGIKNITSGTAYKALTIEKLKDFRIFCPTQTSEQLKIVQKIEAWFSLIDKVEVVIDASLAKSERLRKSILKFAFEGKLVN